MRNYTHLPELHHFYTIRVYRVYKYIEVKQAKSGKFLKKTTPNSHDFQFRES